MDAILHSDVYGNIVCQPVEKNATDLESIEFAASGDFGLIKIQKIDLRDYNVKYSTYRFNSNTNISLEHNTNSVELKIILINDLCYRIHGLEQVKIGQNQFCFTYAGKMQTELLFEKDKEYMIIEVCLNSVDLQKWANDHPRLEYFLFKANQKIPAILYGPNRRITPEILLLVFDITHRWSERHQHINQFPHIAVTRPIRLILKLSDKKVKNKSMVYPKNEIKIFKQTMEYALRYYDNPGTMKELASEMLIKEATLRKKFKEFYNVSVFGLIMNEKMNKAIIQLLHTNASIMTIAANIGYHDEKGFIKYFNRRFGFSPEILRK